MRRKAAAGEVFDRVERQKAEGQKNSIEVDSVRIINKKQSPATVNAAQNALPNQTSKTSNGQTVSKSRVPQSAGEVKVANEGDSRYTEINTAVGISWRLLLAKGLGIKLLSLCRLN